MNNRDFNPTALRETGNTYEEVIKKLYQKYGPNYQVVNYDTDFSGGFLGFFQKTQVVVDYILVDREQSRSRRESSLEYSGLSGAKSKTSSGISSFGSSSSSSAEDFASSRDKLLSSSGIDSNLLSQRTNIELLKTMQELKVQVQEIASSTTSPVHASVSKIEEMLDANGFSHAYISYISSKLKNEFPYEKLENFDEVEKKVVDWIGQSITIAPKTIHKLPRVTVLVGPTGVGKTTTLSKLASNTILEAKKQGLPIPSMRLITIDKVRVGAEEQLKTYAAAMKVPFSKAQCAEDLKNDFEEFKDRTDYFFIDTSGFSPKDSENIGKMRAILNVPGINPDTYLVVDATKKASDIAKIVQNYEQFDPKSVIITKCDETSSIGNVLSVLFEKNKAVSYITDGQKVPRDIRRASVVDFLKSLSEFNIDRSHIDDLFPEDN